MAAGSAGAGEMPPEDAAMLMQILGMGGAPAGALPPEAAAMMGAAVGAGAPVAPGGAPLPGFPSTDPAAIAQMRAQDHAQLDALQDSAMATAAQSMAASPAGVPVMGAPPLGGDPFAGPPVAPPMGDPSMGAGGAGAMPLPPELAAAFGGPDYGGMESEYVGPLPGGEFADELGTY